jgi:hypothetical protein
MIFQCQLQFLRVIGKQVVLSISAAGGSFALVFDSRNQAHIAREHGNMRKHYPVVSIADACISSSILLGMGHFTLCKAYTACSNEI